jgi:hypothetical protein
MPFATIQLDPSAASDKFPPLEVDAAWTDSNALRLAFGNRHSLEMLKLEVDALLRETA